MRSRYIRMLNGTSLPSKSCLSGHYAVFWYRWILVLPSGGSHAFRNSSGDVDVHLAVMHLTAGVGDLVWPTFYTAVVCPSWMPNDLQHLMWLTPRMQKLRVKFQQRQIKNKKVCFLLFFLFLCFNLHSFRSSPVSLLLHLFLPFFLIKNTNIKKSKRDPKMWITWQTNLIQQVF